MNYLTFAEYSAMGGVCDETAFSRNIDRACAVVGNATFGRINAMANVPQSVKACIRDLVEYYATNMNVNEKSISSRSQDAGAVSESISYQSKDADDNQTDISNIITDYLGSETDDNGTPLLYLGARV